MFLLRPLFIFLFFTAFVFSQNNPPVILAEGNQFYCPGDAIPIVSSISISDADIADTSLDEIFIQIAEGYVFGQDVLTLDAVIPGITPSWNATQGLLTLTGPATFESFENAISNIVFQTNQTFFIEDRQFTINLGAANFLPSTGHYYFYVQDVGINWEEARIAAENQNYFGLQGYLATVTTPEEATLVGEQSSGTGWIGASDADNEGSWIWVTGPEAGTLFWQGVSNGNTVNNEFAFWNTAEPNNFNGNEDYAHITDPSIGILGSWNDLPLDGDPPGSPYHPQGYVVEFGGLDGEPAINLSASTTIRAPELNFENSVQVCGNTNLNLVASSNTGVVEWYNTQNDVLPQFIGDLYNITVTETTTFWVLPKVNGCDLGERFPITISVNQPPEVSNITINQCEDDMLDGVSVFNLSFYEDEIISGDSSNFQINFFEDEALTNQIDSTFYINTENNQIIYAQVTDLNSTCNAVAEVVLSVSSENFSALEFLTCDNLEENGLVAVNFEEINAFIQTNLGFNFIVEGLYTSQNEALLLQNKLPNSFTLSQPYQQTVYARLDQLSDCYSIVEVNIMVEALPELLPDEEVYYCQNTFPEPIILTGGILNDIPNNFYYNWSTGETTINIEVNEVGLYTVNVTKPNGCTNTRTISVLPSDVATIESVNVQEFLGDNNSITIEVTGNGSYAYSLNNFDGPYQEENTFNNLRKGFYNVFVKDVKGSCGVVSEFISIGGFPRFFTPNDDGENDVWTICGFDELNSDLWKVSIFNRYGKLLTQLNSGNRFWDGTLNGKILPTDDYWFKAEFLDGRQYVGHFTLKR